MSEAIQRSLSRWHAMIAAANLDDLPSMLAPEVVFRSPFAYRPYVGPEKVAALLGTVVTVLREFAYQRQFVADDSVALEFGAKVGDLSLKGIDLIRFDEQGRIVDFEVMIRPANALHALGQEMGQRLAAQGITP